ncbi:unnamed protein product [Calypogeia fissa]
MRVFVGTRSEKARKQGADKGASYEGGEVGWLLESSFVGVRVGRVVVYVRKDEASGHLRKEMDRKEEGFLRGLEIHGGENVEGFVDDVGCGITVEGVLGLIKKGVKVDTKYKIVDKKVKLAVVPLPLDAQELLRKAREEPSLCDPNKIGHIFTKETLHNLG